MPVSRKHTNSLLTDCFSTDLLLSLLWRTITLPSSGQKTKLKEKPTEEHHLLLLVSYLAYSLTQKMEVLCSTKLSGYLWTTQHYNQKDCVLFIVNNVRTSNSTHLLKVSSILPLCYYSIQFIYSSQTTTFMFGFIIALLQSIYFFYFMFHLNPYCRYMNGWNT
jgi:hypothetical protein